MRLNALPISAVLLAYSLVASFGLYGERSAIWSWACVLCATIALLWHRHDQIRSSRSLATWLLVGTALLTLCPNQFFSAGVLLLSGTMTVALSKWSTRLAQIGNSILIAGQTLAIQAVAFLGLVQFLLKQHSSPVLAVILRSCLALTGEDAAVAGDIVTVQTEMGLLKILATTELFAVLPSVVTLCGMAFLLAGQGGGVRALLKTAILSALYLPFHAAATILLSIHVGIANPSWAPEVSLLIAIAYWGSVGSSIVWQPSVADQTPRSTLQRGLPIACSMLMAMALAVIVRYSTGGVEKVERRLLVNERNSDWESTLIPMDKKWYGRRSGYNYYLLRELLTHYYHVTVNHSPIDDSALARVDVLLLKTPTAPYHDDEVDAIERFVKRGGGVVLLGDHTNVFGMSDYLNQVMRRFGMRYRFDSQHAMPNGGLTLYKPLKGADHPAVQHVPYFLFGTGCTIDSGLFGEDIVIGYANFTKPADYAVSNFFLHDPVQFDRRYGVVSQVAGTQHGQGRVLAYSDSTAFSNFWMHIPGKPELLLGMVDWANRKNGPMNLRSICVVSLPLLAICGLLFCRRFDADTMAQVFLGTWAVSLGLIGVQNRICYPVVAPHESIHEVAFCTESSEYFIPRTSLFPTPLPGGKVQRDYSTFFQIPPRIGHIARECDSFKESVSRNPKELVIIGPHRKISEESMGLIKNYVTEGGSLLVVVPSDADIQACNLLLTQFDLSISAEEARAARFMSSKSQAATDRVIDCGKPSPFRPITGGTPLLVGDEKSKRVALAGTTHGKGMVVVCSAGDLTAMSSLGSSSGIPNQRQLTMYSMCYWLLESMATRLPPEKWRELPTLAEQFGIESMKNRETPKNK